MTRRVAIKYQLRTLTFPFSVLVLYMIFLGVTRKFSHFCKTALRSKVVGPLCYKDKFCFLSG